MTAHLDALRIVMNSVPNLTVDGLAGDQRPNFARRRADLLHPLHVDEFRRATAWLSHVPKIKTGGESSYRLKHVAEDWAGRYVSNGAMIAAAYHLGFRVEPMPARINALIGVACGRHWPLRPDTIHFSWIQRRYPGNRKIVAPPSFAGCN